MFFFLWFSFKQLKSPQLEDSKKRLSSTALDRHSLIDLNASFKHENRLNNLSLSSVSAENAEGKMSSDSAFQSLGDGLELENDEKFPPPSIKCFSKLEPSKLELQMKSIAEEAKNMRLGKGLCAPVYIQTISNSFSYCRSFKKQPQSRHWTD